MTYLEKYLQDHPECSYADFAIESGCPGMYYPSGRRASDNCPEYHPDCAACWRTEMPTETPTIKDSGNRTEFASGAVRDLQEGKGRCDLLPLDMIAEFLRREYGEDTCQVLDCIDKYQKTADNRHLAMALYYFGMDDRGWDKPTMLLEVAKHFEAGAKKYGERNWEKGIPVRCYIDSAIRHYLKWLRGDTDEPHDRAFCWNIICAAWTARHKPDLNEYEPKHSAPHTCASCGAVIPEGIDVCPNCERGDDNGEA